MRRRGKGALCRVSRPLPSGVLAVSSTVKIPGEALLWLRWGSAGVLHGARVSLTPDPGCTYNTRAQCLRGRQLSAGAQCCACLGVPLGREGLRC